EAIDVNSTLHHTSATEFQAVPKESEWLKRKRILSVLNSTMDGILNCKQAGCETQWYHLWCMELEQEPQNWVCTACEASGRGRGGKWS
ncbi:hypothetical protein L208DRAFT_1403194, partial [Tricholoma matsutake]